MVIFLLSTLILSCKIVSLVCLIISVRSYQWFRVENYAGEWRKLRLSTTEEIIECIDLLSALVNRENIKDLCVSYGAFCNREDQMPLPRLIVILPCALSALSLSLELLNLILLYSVWQRVRSILNFCLGKCTSRSESGVFSNVSCSVRANKYCSLMCYHHPLFLGHCCLSSHIAGDVGRSFALDILCLWPRHDSDATRWTLFDLSNGKWDRMSFTCLIRGRFYLDQ